MTFDEYKRLAGKANTRIAEELGRNPPETFADYLLMVFRYWPEPVTEEQKEWTLMTLIQVQEFVKAHKEGLRGTA